MKCKRVIKVVSALALTVALLVSSGVVSFAATYTTTTKYLDQNTIEVTSVASNLSNGEIATYVAYDGNDFSEANAVYIDQATEKDGSVTFTYQADSDKVKAQVKFGGTGTTETVPMDGLNIDVTVDDGDATSVVVAKVDANYADEYLTREFEVAVPSGKAIKAVSFNGEPVNAWYVKNGALFILDIIREDGNLVITTEEATNSVKLGTVTSEAGKITAFAKAVCEETADFGIIIAAGENADISTTAKFDEADDYTTAVKLPAAGKGADGCFAVEVVDEKLVAGTYTVAAYAGEATAIKTVVIQ